MANFKATRFANKLSWIVYHEFCHFYWPRVGTQNFGTILQNLDPKGFWVMPSNMITMATVITIFRLELVGEFAQGLP